MSILNLLDRPIAYHRTFAAISGSICAGIFLSQAFYWSQRTADPDGWFWKTQEQWFDETFMTRYEQETARKKLVAIGVLEQKKQGIPAKLFYRINRKALEIKMQKYADSFAEIQQTGVMESSKQVCGKPTGKDDGFPHTGVMDSNIQACGKPTSILYTETTSEIISETTPETDQYPPNPQEQINQEGGGEAIKVEVEILEEESIQKPATVPRDQKPSLLTALTIGEDQKRSAAAPISIQQEIQVLPPAPVDVATSAQLMERKLKGILPDWKYRSPEGRAVIDPGFLKYVSSQMKGTGRMHPDLMANNHILKADIDPTTFAKVEGYWNLYQGINEGTAELSHHTGAADRKYLDRCNAMNALAAKYGNAAS